MIGKIGDWSAIRKLLCIRLDSMGDVLMTTPALRALRETFPHCRLTLLTSASGEALAPHLGDVVDDVLAYRAPWIKSNPTDPADPYRGADFASDRALVDRLAQDYFDAAVVFTVYSQSALPAATVCTLAGIPRCLAYARENPYRLVSDWVAETEPQSGIRHEVRRQLDLVAAVGAHTDDERLLFRIGAEARMSLRQRLSLHGINLGVNGSGGDEARMLVVHPGATAASRRWPAERFARAALMLRQGLGRKIDIVFTGGAGERTLCNALQKAVGEGSHSFAGELSLGELAALIEHAAVLLSNNSGPVHIAAATGTPVVDLYALTNPQHTPWQVPNRVLSHDVSCKYCYKSVCPERHHDCLTKVSAEAAVEAVLALWPPRLRSNSLRPLPVVSASRPANEISTRPTALTAFSAAACTRRHDHGDRSIPDPNLTIN